MPEIATQRSGRTVPDLGTYSADKFQRGRSNAIFALWTIVQPILFSSPIPGSWYRRALLRAFGAQIGRGVVIKPGVRVKFPWRLVVGDRAWLGEDVWVDNLAIVHVGANCCISQGAYLCTGSHDWSRSTFDLITKPIRIEDGAWIAAKAVVGPGVSVGTGAILGLASVATRDLGPWEIWRGNPARPVGMRVCMTTRDASEGAA